MDSCPVDSGTETLGSFLCQRGSRGNCFLSAGEGVVSSLGGGPRSCSGTWLVTVCSGHWAEDSPPPPLRSASPHCSPQVYGESCRDRPEDPGPTRGAPSDSAPPPSFRGARADCASPGTAQPSAPSFRAVASPDEGGGNSLIPQGGPAWECVSDFTLTIVLKLKDVIGTSFPAFREISPLSSVLLRLESALKSASLFTL